MSPRPRKVSDEAVFAATYRAIARVGPNALTLALIAEEAGVTAGALVQRFGSKRDLLLDLSSQAADSAGEFLAQVRARHRSPLAALRDYTECMAHLASSPEALARNLAYLQLDLADAEFRRYLATQYRATAQGLTALVQDAIAAGELVAATDALQVTRTLEAVMSGALLTFAIYRDGTAKHWMRQHVEAVLAPWMRAATGKAVRKR